MSQKKNEDRVKEQIAHIQLLYCAADILQYACIQLKDTGIQQQEKVILSQIQRGTKQKINQFFSKVPRENMKKFDELSADNAAYMADMVSMVGLIPPDQLEWFSEEVFKVSQRAVNKHNKETLEKIKAAKNV